MIPQNRVESEKPENPAAGGAQPREQRKVAHGAVGFNDILQRSLAKLDVSSFPDR